MFCGIEYCTLKDLNINVDIEETGTTQEENAIIKAKAYYDIAKIPVITDDSGLIIDKLEKNEQPGVFVRRHNGVELTDEEIIKLYSEKIEKVGGRSEGAFVICVAIVDENGKIHTNVLEHKRLFVSKPCSARTKGYPMNSLIYDEEKNQYLAEVYEGKNIYKGNSFEKDLEFIKNVFKM